MIVPKAIIIPILPSVLPNPFIKVFVISASDKPPTKPIRIPAASKLKNGWILNFDEATIINATTKISEINMTINPILLKYFG